MAFVDKIIGPDEKLIGVTTIHWMYGAIGILWLVGFQLLGLYTNVYSLKLAKNFPGNNGLIATDIMANGIYTVCTIFGVLMFVLYLTTMITTEIALTNKRIIYKRGWIFVKVSEADLDEMKAAGVNNGWFGRFLNYGYIELDARFIKNMNFPAISDPYRFVKAANEIRGNLRQDSMTVLLEGHGKAKVVDDKTEIIPEPKEKVHKLEDPRYESISNDPKENTKEVAQETKEAIQHRTQEMAAPQQKPQSEALEKPHGPIVFEKETLKDKLKEKIIDNFSDTTHEKTA